MTLNQRSVQFVKKSYPIVETVEKWIPQARKKKDLFGCIDLLAVGNGETVAIQTTSASNVAARKKKILGTAAYKHMKEAGWKIEIHGWFKRENRWHVTVQSI